MNALFGIEASNEYRRDTVMTSSGIAFEGSFGICNKPKNPKAWYQFGQRIVGWSRIMQICFMLLVEPYIETIVNGDTDSVKFVARDSSLQAVRETLDVLSQSIDKAKADVCARVKMAYPPLFDSLDNIGHYELEFTTKQFCASWNKAYVSREIDKRTGKPEYNFTIAGVPTKRRSNANSCFIGINGYAMRLEKLGYSFEQVCSLLLGYNVTLGHDIILMNGRRFPEWGETFSEKVTDYKGDTYLVAEPCALALYPMGKTINDTSSADNAANAKIARSNNPNVNLDNLIVHAHGITDIGGFFE